MAVTSFNMMHDGHGKPWIRFSRQENYQRMQESNKRVASASLQICRYNVRNHKNEMQYDCRNFVDIYFMRYLNYPIKEMHAHKVEIQIVGHLEHQ